MVKAIVDISERANRVLNILKAVHGFKDKSQAIDFIAKEYGEEILEEEIRPEYFKKLEKIRSGIYNKFNSVEELRKATSS